MKYAYNVWTMNTKWLFNNGFELDEEGREK